jgi:hypothetical protein
MHFLESDPSLHPELSTFPLFRSSGLSPSYCRFHLVLEGAISLHSLHVGSSGRSIDHMLQAEKSLDTPD